MPAGRRGAAGADTRVKVAGQKAAAVAGRPPNVTTRVKVAGSNVVAATNCSILPTGGKVDAVVGCAANAALSGRELVNLNYEVCHGDSGLCRITVLCGSEQN